MGDFLNQIENYLQTSLQLSLAAAYVGGLFASLTPCMYPMIPVTAEVIGNSNLGGSRMRGFFLSLCYVTGMAFTYSSLGVFAAATGRFFGAVNTNPWTLLVIGNIILLLGLNMLDVFQLPTIAPRVAAEIKKTRCIFAIGLLSGLVVGPCTCPVLGALLAYVATTRDMVFGGLLLFVFAFGMGAILLVVGTFSGVLTSIPKSGIWMIRVKKAMGFVMILLAEYFLLQAGRMFA